MRLTPLVLSFFGCLGMAPLHAQNSAPQCSPEALQRERNAHSIGEYKGDSLVTKLQNLIKEMSYLVHTPFERAQKKAMEHCLNEKDKLFVFLMKDPEARVQETAAYQEVLADFHQIHNDPRTALIHLDRALELNPRSLALMRKSLELSAKVNDAQLSELAGKPVALSEASRVLNDISTRAAKIVDHPEASRPVVIIALNYQALVARIQKNSPKEMQILAKILSLDPKNTSAIQRRFNYFVSKNMVNDTLETMKRLTRENMALERNWQQMLILLSNVEQWESFVTWYKKAPAPLVGNNAEIQTRLARAYLEMGLKVDAENIMKKLPAKLSGKAATIAAQNRARLIEVQGDDFKKLGRLSEALDAYKKALPSSPRPLSVKEKISVLIYEYRKGQNFPPSDGTTKDLEEVVSLLDNSANQTELKSNLFAIYLHSLQLLKKPVQLKKACARYKEIYPELLRAKDYQSYCQ